jgi:hypothetical protein
MAEVGKSGFAAFFDIRQVQKECQYARPRSEQELPSGKNNFPVTITIQRREREKERVRHAHITYYLAELMRKQMNPKDHITNSNEILQYKAQLYIQHVHILSLR